MDILMVAIITAVIFLVPNGCWAAYWHIDSSPRALTSKIARVVKKYPSVYRSVDGKTTWTAWILILDVDQIYMEHQVTRETYETSKPGDRLLTRCTRGVFTGALHIHELHFAL